MTRMTNCEIVLTGPYDDMELQPENGYVPQAIDFGWPALRENREVRPSQNGEDDYTKFFGARAISFPVGIRDDMALSVPYLEDELKKWLLPELESYLEFRRRGDMVWRRIRVKGTNNSQRLTLASFRYDMATMSFRAPDGVFELGPASGDRDFSLPETLTLSPSVTNETGRIYSATQLNYDGSTQKRYPVTEVIGAGIAVNRGTAPVYPTIRIYGRTLGPRLINMDTGQQLKFLDAYQINAGEYVEVNFRDGTVLLNGDPTNTRFNKVDFSVSEFFTMAPRKSNNLRYDTLSYDPPSHIEVDWFSSSL